MRTALCMLAVGAAALVAGLPARADDAADPRESIKAIDQSLVKAGELYRAKKPQEAAAALAEAKASFQTLSDMDVPADLRPQVERIGERLAAADRLMAKAQAAPAKATTAAAKKPSERPAASQTAKAKKPAKSKRPGKPAPVDPSFTADVAPVLIARCGNCHVRASRGGLSMATFAALEKGNKNGPVIRPGASQGSRIIEVIASGYMPRGGGRVAPEELFALSRWIDAGALFDGTDRNAPLGQTTAAPMVDGLVKASGKESVQFNRDLAPVLVTNCIRCHRGDQPAGQLRMETFGDLLKGGTTGKVIDPENPDDSLIVKRLRGIDGDRMPQDKPALPDATIAQFATWIKEGAKFDGADAAQPLKVAIEGILAGRLSHEELTAKRLAQALKTWALAAPDERAEQLQTVNFILVGNVSSARMAEVAELAEAERAKIVRLLKLDAAVPLVKGSLVLFVFKRSFDYSEFVRMVEERELPRGTNGHARTKGSDAYACLAVGTDADAGLPALVAEQIAGGFLYGLGDVPAWFAAGGGRAIAARVEPKNPLVKQWDAEQQSGGGSAAGGDAFLSATFLDSQATANSYAFVRALSTNLPRFQSLIAALSEGRDFGQAIEDTYRANARTLVEKWLRGKPTGRG